MRHQGIATSQWQPPRTSSCFQSFTWVSDGPSHAESWSCRDDQSHTGSYSGLIIAPALENSRYAFKVSINKIQTDSVIVTCSINLANPSPGLSPPRFLMSFFVYLSFFLPLELLVSWNWHHSILHYCVLPLFERVLVIHLHFNSIMTYPGIKYPLHRVPHLYGPLIFSLRDEIFIFKMIIFSYSARFERKKWTGILLEVPLLHDGEASF